MSSLVRRSTATAAGIAALGAGFAGHALAAPVPAAPAAPEFEAPAAPDTAALQELLANLPAGPAAPGGDVAQLPELFSFDMPAATQSSVPAAEMPGLDSLGDAGGEEGPVNFDVGPDPAAPGLPNTDSVDLEGTMPDPAENAPAVSVGPMEFSGDALSGMMGGLG